MLILIVLPLSLSTMINIYITIGTIVSVQIGYFLTSWLGSFVKIVPQPAVPLPVIIVSIYLFILDIIFSYNSDQCVWNLNKSLIIVKLICYFLQINKKFILFKYTFSMMSFTIKYMVLSRNPEKKNPEKKIRKNKIRKIKIRKRKNPENEKILRKENQKKIYSKFINLRRHNK